MNNLNELPPEMLEQAHLLGGGRAPTKAEIRKEVKEKVFLAITQVAGTAATSLLEASFLFEESTDRSLNIAKCIMETSESLRDGGEFKGFEGKQRLRNSLAAQLVHSALRGKLPYDKDEELVAAAFESATRLVKKAEEDAEKYVEENVN